MQAYIIAVGWKDVDFALEKPARQRKFMCIAVATQVARDQNLEFFVARAQVLNELGKGTQGCGVVPEESIEYRKIIQPELYRRADGGIACVWIKATDMQVGDVQQSCKQFLFWHDGLPG
ncbi:hypothetical protein ASD58_08640 [Duganella sp. Root1480D1]|nr:hypothetical protein ASD58_08640 [Duganella sp. Root1480D1]